MMKFRVLYSLPAGLLAAVLVCITVQGSGCALVGSEPATSAAQGGPVARDISDVELLGLMEERTDLILIDVRTDKEWDGGHIEGACFLDYLEDDFKARAEQLPKDRPIALYCAAGGRSEDAMKLLAKAGFTELYNLRGGFYGWEDAGRAVSQSEAIPLPLSD